MIRYAKRKHRRVFLSTDLTASNAERQEELVRAGSDVLSFSLDRATGSDSDGRCIPEIDAHLTALLRLRQNGHRFSLHCNVTWHKENLGEAQAVISYLHDKGKIVISVRVASYPPSVSVRSRDPGGLALGPEDAGRLRELAEWLINRKRDGYRIVNPVWYLENLPLHVSGQLRWDCGAMRDILSIDTDGSLAQCSYYLPSAPFGAIPLRVRLDELSPETLQHARAAVARNLDTCNAACFSPAYCCTSYFRHHRLELLETYLRF